MADYTTLALVKTELGISGSNHDARLTALITEASALIDSYCGRTFELKTLTEKVRGYGGASFLRLSHTPIGSITSIVINNYTLPATEYSLDNANAGLVAGDFQDTAPLRYAMGHSFSSGRQRRLYEVTYTGGYVVSGVGKNLPAAIERACVEIVRSLFLMKDHDSRVKAESVDGVGSVTYSDFQIADDRKFSHLLGKYRAIGAIL